MMHNRKSRSRQKMVEPLPLPASLEEAFEAVANLDAMHPTSRGTTFGAIRIAEARANAPRTPQDGR